MTKKPFIISLIDINGNKYPATISLFNPYEAARAIQDCHNETFRPIMTTKCRIVIFLDRTKFPPFFPN